MVKNKRILKLVVKSEMIVKSEITKNCFYFPQNNFLENKQTKLLQKIWRNSLYDKIKNKNI